MNITSIDLLQLLFVYLRLTHQISWDWKWVLFPLWCSLTIKFAIGIAAEVRKVK